MNYDIHVHIAGTGDAIDGNYLSPKTLKSRNIHRLYKVWGLSGPAVETHGIDELMQERLLEWIRQSELDRVVLLALDPVYRPDGALAPEATQMVVNNDFVANIASREEKVLFGASVHPFRLDALTELERLVQRGACLNKWIPSAQQIPVDDKRCLPFYEALAHYNLPLLCHSGPEHLLSGNNRLNDPRRLQVALERGVRVIAAHCATRIYAYEPSWYSAWRRLALDHEHMYGDLSACALLTRALLVHRIRKDAVLSTKVLYGSDFPVPTMPSTFVHHYGFSRMRDLAAIANPVQKAYQTMREVDLDDRIFTRAGDILRIPDRANRRLLQGIESEQ